MRSLVVFGLAGAAVALALTTYKRGQSSPVQPVLPVFPTRKPEPTPTPTPALPAQLPSFAPLALLPAVCPPPAPKQQAQVQGKKEPSAWYKARQAHLAKLRAETPTGYRSPIAQQMTEIMADFKRQREELAEQSARKFQAMMAAAKAQYEQDLADAERKYSQHSQHSSTAPKSLWAGADGYKEVTINAN